MPSIAHPQQGPVDDRGLFALSRIEELVARTHGQAIRLANDRRAKDRDRKGKVDRHPAHDQQLLEVLAAEHGQIRLHEVEQLGDHGRHAIEMARPAGPFEDLSQLRDANADALACTERIDRIDFGQEQRIASMRLESFRIGIGCARVAREVFAGAELGRIDEHAGDDGIATFAGKVDQGMVPGVQVAHGRHEADALLALPPLACPGAKFVRLAEKLHGRLSRYVRGRGRSIGARPAHRRPARRRSNRGRAGNPC